MPSGAPPGPRRRPACDEHRMQVAVAGMGGRDDEDVVPGRDGVDARRSSRRGAPAADRRPRSAAVAAPHEGRVRAGARRTARPLLIADRMTRSRPALRPPRTRRGSRQPRRRRGLGHVDLGEQQCGRVVGRARACFQSFTARRQCRSISSKAAGVSPRAVTRRPRPRMRPGCRRSPTTVRGASAARPKPDGDLGDDPERALGADHEPDQVVPRDALGGPLTEPDDLAGGRDDLEREHVVAR